MFKQHELFFKGPYKMRASTYEYPFSFQFPGTFEYIKEFREDAFWPGEHTQGPRPLPPTCWGETFDGGFEISYHITAKIPRRFGDWEDEVQVNFSTCRVELNPALMPKLAVDFNSLYRRFRLNDQGAPLELRKREALKESFHHSSENDRINFSVHAVAPTAIVFGKPYIVEPKVISPDDEASWSSAPELQLRDYALILKIEPIFEYLVLLPTAPFFRERHPSQQRGSEHSAGG
jgi:hypothetical protein